jgi:nitroreductase
MLEKLISFLQDELEVPAEQINLALRHTQAIPNQLPMQLWQYGLINMGQLEKIFDWLEAA